MARPRLTGMRRLTALAAARPGSGQASLSMSASYFTARQASVVGGDRTLRASLNRVLRSFAQQVRRKAERLSAPTYDTGLFFSSWSAVVRMRGTRFTIELKNSAPYAEFVHRRNERRTVINRYIRPMLRDELTRLTKELNSELRAPLLNEIRRRAAGG